MSPLFRRVAGCFLSILMVLAGVSVAFPQDPLTVDIELFYDGTWNNVNVYTYHRDHEAPIVITRGRPNESTDCDPGKLQLELNNRDGRFSPRNPNSPLYGKIGRNTPIRVKVTHDTIEYVRFVGEVTSWPPRWDVTGLDVWVPIEAWGILKRLGAGEKPIRSSLYRATAGLAAGDFVPDTYMPLEDGPDATSAAIDGGSVTISGSVTFSANADLLGSDPLPTLASGARIIMHKPAYTGTNIWTTQVLMMVPSAPASNTTLIDIAVGGSGYVSRYRVVLEPGSPDQIRLYYTVRSTGVETAILTKILFGDVYPSEAEFYGSWRLYGIGEEFTLGDLRAYMSMVDATGEDPTPGAIIGSFAPGTLTSITLMSESGTDGIGFGHAAAWTDPAYTPGLLLGANAAAMDGWPAEEALDRFERLCAQHHIPFDSIGSGSAPMGAERTVPLLEALRDCETTDQGFLFERRDELGLKFRTNGSRYNQTAIQLDYGGGHISPPFDPEPDDMAVANDREVKRRGGSSARRELTSGPLSVQDPPDGIGRYDDSITVDAYEDDQLTDIANWRLHVGTWDAERYPRVRVDLSASGNTSLIPQIAAADSGDLLVIENLPAWLPPEDAELLIEGYTETIGFFTWEFVFNCSPAGPYNVVGVWDLLSHELHTAMNTAITSADIANTDITQPMLATSGLGSGYGVMIGGEQLQVTAVAASTITFGNTGTASSGSSGSRTPGLPTGAAAGDLVVIFASTRNSGTGVPDTPANWDRWAIFPATANCQVFARIYDGVWSMPTVTFTAGSANEDTIAQSMRLAGKWHDAGNVLLDSAHILNASAQNIQLPALDQPQADDCIILYFGWKQDDFTSVASPGTEIQEASSTAGNDASQVWSYTIQTTAAEINFGAVFTVTGGASAISRGGIAAVRCDYQTATVTRSVNGVSASHSAGDAVTAYRPMRWALM